MEWTPRSACEEDISELEELIPLSIQALQVAHYSRAQMDAAMGPVFGVDRQLIRDGTYFVIEYDARIVGCGGWSRRKSLFGSDGARTGEDDLLDPACDAARIRAFFVHPVWPRRGMGRSILTVCEKAIADARFNTIELVATLAGEPLYAASGYAATERYAIPLANGLDLPVVKMRKSLVGSSV